MPEKNRSDVGIGPGIPDFYIPLFTRQASAIQIGREQLAAAGVRATLGVLRLTPDADGFLFAEQDAFLTSLAEAADQAGIAIRFGELTSSDSAQLHEEHQQKLSGLDMSWSPSPQRWQTALAKLRHVASVPAEATRDMQGRPWPAAPDSRHTLADWVRDRRDQQQQRIASILDTVHTGLQGFVDDPSVHAVICPPPRPYPLSLSKIAPLIPVMKDVDGAHPTSLASLFGSGWDDRIILSDMAVHARRLPEEDHYIAAAGVNLIVLATILAALRAHTIELAIEAFGDGS